MPQTVATDAPAPPDISADGSPTTEFALPGWQWARAWELWVALGLATFLRLWHIEQTQFLGDQVGIFEVGRQGIVQHALPVTSIPYSIGGFSPPWTTYFMLPFAALGNNPLPAVISIALWNVFAIGLAYVFARRYFGRVVAGSAALLLATSPVLVNYSRLIWQVSYLPGVLALWAMTLYYGCVRGKRGWLAANVGLLAIAVTLHPVATSLAFVTLAGVLLAPRRPRVREFVGAAVAALLVALPSVLWEIADHFPDVVNLHRYAGQGSTIDFKFLYRMFQFLGAPSSTDFGPASLYAYFGPWYPFINVASVLVFAAGYLVLSWRVFLPARTLWRAETSPRWQDALRGWSLAVWRGLRQDAAWRGDVLLWLWVSIPCVFMIRHNSPPEVHYFMVTVPAMFIISGFAVRWLFERFAVSQQAGFGAGALRALHDGGSSARGWRPSGFITGLVTALLAVLVLAQGAQAALYPTAMISPGFDALRFFGYPLGVLQSADAQLSALQREQGVSKVLVSENTSPRYQSQLHYMLVGEHGDRSGFDESCLILPAAHAGPALIVSTDASSYAAALLPQLGSAVHVGDVRMTGSAPLPVYRVAGATPTLVGDTPVTPVEFRDANGAGLRLDAVARVTPTMLRMRWTVLATTPAGQPAYIYRSIVRVLNSDGGSGMVFSFVECRPKNWQAGETVFTWQSLIAPAAPGQAASTNSTPPANVAVQVSQGTGGLATPTLIGLRLIAWDDQRSFWRLPPSQAPGTPPPGEPGQFTARGEYALPTSLSP